MLANIADYGHPAIAEAISLEGIQQFENRYGSVYWEVKELHIMLSTIRQRTDTGGQTAPRVYARP